MGSEKLGRFRHHNGEIDFPNGDRVRWANGWWMADRKGGGTSKHRTPQEAEAALSKLTHTEDCAIHGCEGWNGERFCDCGSDPSKARREQPQGEATPRIIVSHGAPPAATPAPGYSLAQTEGGEKPRIMPIQTNTQNLAVQSNTDTAVEYGNPANTGSDPEGETERAPLNIATAAHSPSGTAKSGRELPSHCSKCGKPICNPATMTIASGMAGKIDQFYGYCSCALHFVPSEPVSPPSQPAGGAREFVIEWAKQYKETYLQLNDIAAVCEAYAAEQVRRERKRYANALVDPLSLWEIFR